MTCSRRELCLLVAALAASPAVATQEPQRLSSKVFPYGDMPVRERNGNQSRPVLSGNLHNGDYMAVHETRLAPGGMPHPPHRHQHEEMFLIREGTLEVTINGRSTLLGPGSVGFVASYDEHGIHNAGTAPTEYFVIALGKDT